MSDNNMDEQLLRKQEQAGFFTEQSNLFGNDVSDISLADSVYIDGKMRTEGEKARGELSRYQRERDAGVETEKAPYLSEVGLVYTVLDLKREKMDEDNKLALESVKGIEANKVRIKGIKHARMLDRKVRNAQLSQEETEQKQANEKRITDFTERVSGVDGTGNFEGVKSAYNELTQLLTVMDSDRSEITMEMADRAQRLYESALNIARAYVDSHSIWKFKAVVPWGLGRKRKNTAAEIVRELERGSLHVKMKSLVPWIDEKREAKKKSAEQLNRESNIEKLNEQIIMRDVVTKELDSSKQRNIVSRKNITEEIDKHTKEIIETDKKLKAASEKVNEIEKKQSKSKEVYSKKYAELSAEIEKNKSSKVMKDYEVLKNSRTEKIRRIDGLERNIAKDQAYIRKLIAARDAEIAHLNEKSALDKALKPVEDNATRKVLEGDADANTYLKNVESWTEGYNNYIKEKEEEDANESIRIKASLVSGWSENFTLSDILKSEELMHAVYLYGRSRDMSPDDYLSIVVDQDNLYDMDYDDEYKEDFTKWKDVLTARALETFAKPEWLERQKTDITKLIKKVNDKLGKAEKGDNKRFFDLFNQDMDKLTEKKDDDSQNIEKPISMISTVNKKEEDRLRRENYKGKIEFWTAMLEERKKRLKDEIDAAIKAEMSTDENYLQKKEAFEAAEQEVVEMYSKKIQPVNSTIEANTEVLNEEKESLQAIENEIRQIQEEYEKIREKNNALEAQISELEYAEHSESYEIGKELTEESRKMNKLRSDLETATKSRSDKHIKRDLDDDELARKSKRITSKKKRLDENIRVLEQRAGVKKKDSKNKKSSEK